MSDRAGTDRVQVFTGCNEARIAIGQAIRSLEDHPDVMVCPVADWIVSLKEVLIDMAHTDGEASDG